MYRGKFDGEHAQGQLPCRRLMFLVYRPLQNDIGFIAPIVSVLSHIPKRSPAAVLGSFFDTRGIRNLGSMFKIFASVATSTANLELRTDKVVRRRRPCYWFCIRSPVRFPLPERSPKLSGRQCRSRKIVVLISCLTPTRQVGYPPVDREGSASLLYKGARKV